MIESELKQPSAKKVGIWNPWIDIVQQEALDLTIQKENENTESCNLDYSYIGQYKLNFFETINSDYYHTISRDKPYSYKPSKIEKEPSLKTLKRRNRAKTLKKIENIKESCDCRFCYEDHILKMRLKSSNPGLL